MTQPPSNDIPRSAQPAAEASATSVIQSEYATFFSKVGQTLTGYAKEYATNRADTVKRITSVALQDPTWATTLALLHKVLAKAEFIPAHPERYEPMAMGTPEYFVFHRPGDDPPSCTFSNTVLTFTIPPAYDGGKTQATHFIIGPSGQLVQMIDLADKSRHVGDSTVNNANSVGVEISGSIHEPITDAQFEAVAELLATMSVLFPKITMDATRCVLHQNIARDRRDPGEFFSLSRVLKRAKVLYTRVKSRPGATLYKSPFDPSDLVPKRIQALLDAANKSLAPGQRALMVSAASTVEQYARLDRLQAFDRTSASRLSEEQARKQLAWVNADTATRSQLDAQLTAALNSMSPERAVRIKQRNGVDGFDWSTGLWKDGKTI
jgi:hypothetical protein